MDLFFFGTLRDTDLLEAVLGGPADRLERVEARLPDVSIQRAADYDFPLLVSSPGGEADGILVSGLSPDDIDRIRFFEDYEYELRPTAVLVEGEARAAYVFSATSDLPSSGEPWTLAGWTSAAKTLMLAVTRELMATHYGRIDPADVDAVWHAIYDRLAAEIDLER